MKFNELCDSELKALEEESKGWWTGYGATIGTGIGGNIGLGAGIQSGLLMQGTANAIAAGTIGTWAGLTALAPLAAFVGAGIAIGAVGGVAGGAVFGHFFAGGKQRFLFQRIRKQLSAFVLIMDDIFDDENKERAMKGNWVWRLKERKADRLIRSVVADAAKLITLIEKDKGTEGKFREKLDIEQANALLVRVKELIDGGEEALQILRRARAEKQVRDRFGDE